MRATIRKLLQIESFKLILFMEILENILFHLFLKNGKIRDLDLWVVQENQNECAEARKL